jgi:hypothetical protein
MQRLADQVVDDIRSVVLRCVDVVDAELDRPAQDGPSRARVGWRPEHAGTGELHRAKPMRLIGLSASTVVVVISEPHNPFCGRS